MDDDEYEQFISGLTQDEQLIIGSIEAGLIDDAADYLQRGRAFAELDLATLRTQWVDVIRRRSRGQLNKELLQQDADLRAEFGLRKETPPWELVQDEMEAICRRAARTLETLRDEPEFIDAAARLLAKRLKRQS